MCAVVSPQVRVGVGVFVLKTAQDDPTNPNFLVGKRINSHGSGTYALPGGHLEFGETPEDCAVRELLEETGLRVQNMQFLTATNDYMPKEGKHYITLFMVCERLSDMDEAENLEPHKCEGWRWMSWSELNTLVQKQLDAGEDEVVEQKVFMPLVSLMHQRPGITPASKGSQRFRA